MSKVLKTVAKVASVVATVVAVAALVTGNPALAATLWKVAQIAGTIAAVAGTAAQMTAKRPPARGSPNLITIGANQPMPIVFGETYVGGNKVHEVGYGGTVAKVENPYKFEAIVHSGCGPIQEFTGLYADFAAVALLAGAATGYFSGFLYADQKLGNRPESAALAPYWAGAPDWSSSHKLSGFAATGLSLKFDKDGKVFSSGEPQWGATLKGVKTYDPRLDSTYPGGSGPQRINDRSTWAYSENPGVVGLTYVYGWFHEGKKQGGIGMPVEGIDMARWVEFANVCDANGWKIGGVVYEPGSRWDNLKDICAAGGGEPYFDRHLLGVNYNAPRVSLDTITKDDIADDGFTVSSGRTWRERLNTIAPKYRSAEHKWEYVPAADVSVPAYVTDDGEEKREEITWNLVQSKDQAAQLAAYELVNRREIGQIEVSCKPRLMRYSVGDMLTFNLPDTVLNGLDAVIIRPPEINPDTGEVKLTMLGETADKHDFALGKTTTAPPVPRLLDTQELDEASVAAASQSAIDEAFDLANQALNEAEGALASAAAASQSAIDAATAKVAAQGSAATAAADKALAEASKNAAATSATNAAGSATSAAGSATAASGSATSATNSATAAATSQSLAANSATNAANSATAANTSASNAATSATAAGNSATSAQNSATSASTSAGAASTSASNASTSASQASTSASNAAGSASSAGTSATNAANSAGGAAGSASAAATSASNAATSSTSAGNSATAANSAKLAAEAANGTAQTAASNASTSAASASTSASNASTSSTQSATYRDQAAGSASTASTQASNALTQATNAQTSAASASASAASASSSSITAANSAASAASSASATAAIVATQATAISDLQGRTAARWVTSSVAGNNRAQLAIYADANSGAGVDIVGDVAISGNLLVGGSVTTSRLAANAVTSSLVYTGSDLYISSLISTGGGVTCDYIYVGYGNGDYELDFESYNYYYTGTGYGSYTYSCTIASGGVSGGHLVLETPFITLSDASVNGGAIAVFYATMDATQYIDCSQKIVLLIDTGEGYGIARQTTVGVVTNNGNSYSSLPISISISVSGVAQARFKIMTGVFQIAGSATTHPSYIRNATLSVLGAKR
jgi:hypothetical protein